MTVLLDCNRKTWESAPAEIGPGVSIGQLITPLTGFSDYGSTYAIDNGAFAGLNVKRFRAILRRQKPRRDRCLWVAVPDVVCSARRTLEVFRHWYPQLHGWPLALVSQNGIGDLEIPWHLLAGVFIGGDDKHKDGPEGHAVAAAAIAMDKWLHFGRVNGEERVASIVEKFGHHKRFSIDGTGISKYTHMRQKLGRAIRGEKETGGLFTAGKVGAA